MAHKEPHVSDKPQPCKKDMAYGSDAIAEQLARLDLQYVALVPGSSYRGLHDSLVNYTGNAAPEMLICLHEEHCVAIAHGYAKVTGKPMAAAVHANVGLMHATMALYNAWCDRVPVVLLGATGPLDAAKRRPWIDWIHTATDQAAIIRPYIKFDDQPHSVNAAISSLIHATAAALAKPTAPVYVSLDLTIQEDAIDPKTIQFPDTERFLAPAKIQPGPSSEDVSQVVAALKEAKRPLFMFGRLNAQESCWQERIQLAEKFGAKVLTETKQAGSFPTDHKLTACAPSVFLSPDAIEVVREADLLIAYDWVDVGGSIKAAYGDNVLPEAKVVNVSLDSALHNGWSKDHFMLPPADITVRADPDKTISALLAASGDAQPAQSEGWSSKTQDAPSKTDGTTNGASSKKVFMSDLAHTVYDVIPPDDICLVRAPLGWKGSDLRVSHPLGFMGMDGGAGIGSGPGQIVGSALALKHISSKLLPVAILGDGDFAMGGTALWTAARYRIPLLVIVANNASYYNDEVHQERIAMFRDRPVDNKWIGQRLDDPAPDVHKIAQGLGCTTVTDSQIQSPSDLKSLLQKAVEEVRNGKPVVVDVEVLPDGYASALEKAK